MAAHSFYLSRAAMRCTSAVLIWYRQYAGSLVDDLAGPGISPLPEVKRDPWHPCIAARRPQRSNNVGIGQLATLVSAP